MKYCLSVLVCLVTLLCPVNSQAWEMEKIEVIPERFGILKVTGMDPEEALPEKELMEALKKYFEESGLEQIYLAIYDKGAREGQGVRGISMLQVPDIKMPFYDATDSPGIGIIFENFIGYNINVGELYEMYIDNEFAADELFAGKPLLFEFIAPGVSKSYSGIPYIEARKIDNGLANLRFEFSPDDPFIRQVKRGTSIVVNASPQRMIGRSLYMDAKIVMIVEDQD